MTFTATAHTREQVIYTLDKQFEFAAVAAAATCFAGANFHAEGSEKVEEEAEMMWARWKVL